MPDSLSVIIEAYNEERNIRDAVDSVTRTVAPVAADYEVIIVNDGSSDRTGEIADEISRRDPRVRALHHERNRGFGRAFRTGAAAAVKTYITSFPGDNDLAADILATLYQSRTNADVITSYMQNPQSRTLLRRTLSSGFVVLLNTVFGLRLRYYNGVTIMRTELVKELPLISDGLTVIAECLIRLIKSGGTYREVGFEHTGRRHHQSKAVSFKSFAVTLKFVLLLSRDIYGRRSNLARTRHDQHNRLSENARP